MDQQNSSTTTGPAGSGQYLVRQGDCIASIAAAHGHSWKTIWNHPQNRVLKSVRKDPNVLLPGDKVFVPGTEVKESPASTDARHKYVRKGIPSMLRLRILDEERPRAGEDYVLDIDGVMFRGKTDADGKIERPIPPGASRGILILGKNQEQYPLDLGCIDPIEETAGVKARLNNLGYICGAIDDELDERTRAAIRRFQKEHNLPETGECDAETREKLKGVYGC